MAGSCDGLRVVDFSNSYPGALATMLLSDAGAEVIKVEPQLGDSTRDHYASLMWHRGKKSVTLDLKTKEGHDKALNLCNQADVVVETFRPGVAAKFGIDYPNLSQSNPGLVSCSITGFGQDGPYSSYKGYEGIVYAKSGRFENYAQQIKKDGPTYGAVYVASYTSAMFSVQGIMSSLLVRERTGAGQKVDVSLLQALSYQDLGGWIQWQMKRKDPDFPITGTFRAGDSVPYLACRTKDGKWLQMGNLAVGLWENWLKSLGLEHLLEDPEYLNANRAREEVRETLRILLLEKMQEKTLDEWMEIYTTKFDVAVEPMLTTQEAMSHSQLVHNGLVVDIVDPEKGKTKQLGAFASFSKTPSLPSAPAPNVGQHNDLIEEFCRPNNRTYKNEQLPGQPLNGLLVIELAEWLAAPIGTALLADLGARVIKVERLEGDAFRSLNPTTTLKTIQGKESLAMDLKTDEAQKILHKLVGRADVLMHNMRPGVPDRLGFSYEKCISINPDLIYAYCGGYGSSGPSAKRGAFHVIGGAVSGGALYQAGKGMPPDPKLALDIDQIKEHSRSLGNANEANPDVNTGAALAAAILMAIYAKEKTGSGQYVEVTMMGANAYANADDFVSFDGKPSRMLPDSELNGLHALYRLYECKSGWVFLACTNDKEWSALCATKELKDVLCDVKFSTHDSRIRYDNQLSEIIGEKFRTKNAEEWERAFVKDDIACVEVNQGSFGDFINTSPYRDLAGPSVKVPHTVIGDYYRYLPYYNLSRTPCISGKNADPGQHTDSILTELGYNAENLERLKTSNIIA